MSKIVEANHRDESRTAATSGMELFVAIVNSFYYFTIVTNNSVLDVEAVLSPPLDTQGMMIKRFSFL